MKRTTSILLALSLAINFLIGGLMMYQYFGLPAAEASNIIKDPGTYGPPAMEIVDDDATISTSDVTLQNTLITGDLHLTQDIEHGVVTLNQVEVQGDLLVSGSGSYKLLLNDCKMGNIFLEDNDGTVTIIVQGQTSIDMADLKGEATLQEEGLDNLAQGFKNVRVNTSKRVLLLGDFNTVTVAAKADIIVARGSIEAVNILSGGVLDLAKDVLVGTMVVDAPFQLKGQGTVGIMDLNVPGHILLQGKLGVVTLHTDGIFLEFHVGSIEKLLVTTMETAVSIMLVEGTHVEYVELNARAGFTGRGQIDKAVINHDGVSMDKPPTIIEIEEGLMATIAGEEYTYVPEPEPEPEPEPLPFVALNSLSNINSLMVGDSSTKKLRPDPTDATLTASSSDTSVATVSLSGKTLRVEGIKSGPATITVTASKDGFRTSTRTFTVTVNTLSDVKKFETDIALSPGKTYVEVYLFDPNPSKYVGKVKIGSVVLEYMESDKYFYGEVISSEAKKSKVKVN